VNTTGWLKGLRVTADGTGIVSHAGVALLRALSDNIGPTAGLSQALASRRLLVHDRGRVLAGLACAIAGGAEVISDLRVIGDQQDLFGLVASVPTAWRTLDEIARGGERALGKITAAVNAARRRAWAQIAARPGYQVIYSVGWPGRQLCGAPPGLGPGPYCPSSLGPGAATVRKSGV
jgi:hypothetical protein